MADNKKTVMLLVVALALGLAGAGLSMLYLNAREAQLREALKPKSQPIAVVVASRDLVKGDKLNSSTLSIRRIPSEYVDPNALTPDEFDSVDGEVLVQNLAKGKPLLKSFIGREFPLDFSDTIPEQRRAMTIQVDEINSIAGLIRPGNRVDLFVNLPASAFDDGKEQTSGSPGNQILPVLENVEVLATGQSTARDYEEKVRLLRGGVMAQPDTHFTNLTLNVTPKEAALLAMSLDKGDLLALLRNRKDTGGSGFVKVSTDTISSHAQQLATAAAIRAAASKADGRLVVGKDGVIRTKDGKVLANQNLIVGEDGTIMTKDGVVLSGRGLRVNDKGQLVTADGKVVDPDNLMLTADGRLITKDGTVLAGSATRSAGGVTQTADGTVVTGSGLVLNGAKLNKDGKLVLADGTVVDPDDVVIRADGTVMTKDGKVLAGVKAGQLAGKLRTDENGNVVTANGAVLRGAKLNKDGKLVLADGSVVDPDDVIVNADGTVTRKDGTLLAGVSADNAGLPGGEATGPGYEVDYLVGGVSQDSVLTLKKVPVLD